MVLFFLLPVSPFFDCKCSTVIFFFLFIVSFHRLFDVVDRVQMNSTRCFAITPWDLVARLLSYCFPFYCARTFFRLQFATQQHCSGACDVDIFFLKSTVIFLPGFCVACFVHYCNGCYVLDCLEWKKQLFATYIFFRRSVTFAHFYFACHCCCILVSYVVWMISFAHIIIIIIAKCQHFNGNNVACCFCLEKHRKLLSRCIVHVRATTYMTRWSNVFCNSTTTTHYCFCACYGTHDHDLFCKTYNNKLRNWHLLSDHLSLHQAHFVFNAGLVVE